MLDLTFPPDKVLTLSGGNFRNCPLVFQKSVKGVSLCNLHNRDYE